MNWESNLPKLRKLPTAVLIILKVYLLVANLSLDGIKNLHGQYKVFRVIKKVFCKHFSVGELYFLPFSFSFMLLLLLRLWEEISYQNMIT